MIEVAVRKQLGEFSLDAAFSAPETGVTALFGASGAGKSTLVNMIAGLAKPDAGHIRFGDQTLFDANARIDLAPERRRIGYVFQDARLFPHMSVRSNLRYGTRFAPREGHFVALDQIVSLLGIEHLLARRPAQLSGGEKQRVAIGRALLAQPRLLLMDEPLAALDARRKGEILHYVERLRDEVGIPIVYVSHAIEEVARLANTLVLLSEGTAVASGPAADVLGRIDLPQAAGAEAAGALIETKVAEHLADDALSALAFSGGRFLVPRLDLPLGQGVRVVVRSRDVSIATSRPNNLSIINMFEGTIVAIGAPVGAAVELSVDIGTPIRARITTRSLRGLSLEVGMPVFALVKSVAIDQQSTGYFRSAGSDEV